MKRTAPISTSQARRWRIVAAPIAVAAVALAVQVTFLVEGNRDPAFDIPIVDEGTYHAAAVRFADGGSLTTQPADPFWQPPLFPLTLGCFYRVAGKHILAARIVLAFVGALICVIVWWLGSRVFTRSVGIVAAVSLALYGPFVFFNTRLLPTGLAVFLDLVAFALWVRCMDRPRRHAWLLFGLVVGAATITVPNAGVLLILAVIGSIASAVRKKRWKPALMPCVFATVGTALPIGAVTARNYVASGEWVLISTNGGMNLYIGNNPRGDETIAIRPGESWRRLARQSRSDEVQTRADQSRYFFRKTLSYAVDRPLDFVQGLGRKTLRLVNAREIPRNVDPYVYRPFSRLLGVLMWRAGPFAFPFGVVAPLAAVGFVVSVVERNRRRQSPAGEMLDGRKALRERLALCAFILAYGASVVAFFVSSRHRLPIIPIVIIFAAAGAVWAWEQIGRCKVMPVAWRLRYAVAAAFVATAVVVNLPVAAPTDRVDFEAEFRLCVGAAYARQDKLDDAERHLREALQIEPDSAVTCSELAHVLVRRGKPDEARRRLQQALALDRDCWEAHCLLGDLLQRRGRTAQAIGEYREALRINPFSSEAHAGLADILVETGELDEAIKHYREASRFTDEPGSMLIHLADALARQGSYEEAIERYRQGLWHVEPDTATLNRIAWLLATCPRVELRDCRRAIEIAEHLCEITEYKHAVALDTLAAAHAECGRIEEAILWVQRAIEIANASGDTEMADSFRSRLEIYKAAKD